jgi:GNAT superfamily N-acetyltransferase
VPFTLVAFSGHEPIGCVSVCHDDVDVRFPLEGPWISGMFVLGIARDQGVGRMLVRAAQDAARDFGAEKLCSGRPRPRRSTGVAAGRSSSPSKGSRMPRSCAAPSDAAHPFRTPRSS